MEKNAPSLVLSTLHALVGLGVFALALTGFLCNMAESSSRIATTSSALLCLVIGTITLYDLGRGTTQESPRLPGATGDVCSQTAPDEPTAD